MRDVKATLAERFGEVVRSGGQMAPGDRVIVGVSGGLDSCVLLHLLRFHAPLPDLELVVAHFDHRMRPGSDADARWVQGLARAWGLPARVGHASTTLRSEADARVARYDFLEAVRRACGARCLVTAHHADDQAETILFRLLRGTGITGLRGIPVSREPALFRPFLTFWRAELEHHARSVRLSWREDPSNRRLVPARNALRHRVLPDVERLVAPGARRALVRLAGLADHEEAGWASVLPELMDPLEVLEEGGTITLDRTELMRLHPAVQGRVLRSLAHRLGYHLDASATRTAVEYAESGRSGGRVDLGGFLDLAIDLHRLRLTPRRSPSPDRPLVIPDQQAGVGEAVLGGVRIPVAWGSERVVERAIRECFTAGELRFPLTVRARSPGDRIRMSRGTKKLKKLFLEARIPQGRRGQTPVVADAQNEILWVPGLARSARALDPADSGLGIGIG